MAVSRSLRYQILRRDNHTCRYCGRSAPEVKLTVDHVVPETLGGSDDPTNLTTACAECNGGKSATPADASHVAAVAEDAQRWAEAQAVVAERMLSQRNLRTSAHDAFDVAWRNNGSFPRPTTWSRSVDTFIATGLPLQVLIDCVEEATDTRKVAAGEMFRYMCGIVWSRIRSMREQVAEVAAAGTGPTAEVDRYARVMALEQWEKDRLEVPAHQVGRVEVADQILSNFSDADIRTYMSKAKVMAEDEGCHIETGPEGESEMFVRAAAVAMEDVYEKTWNLARTVEYLLSALPDSYREGLAAKARTQIVEEMEEEPTEFRVTWWSVHLLADEIRERNAPAVEPANPFLT